MFTCIVAEIEVYECPADTLPSELVDHFKSEFDATCLTSENELAEEFKASKMFTLEFEQSGNNNNNSVLKCCKYTVYFSCVR